MSSDVKIGQETPLESAPAVGLPRDMAWRGDRVTWLAGALMLPISLGLAVYGLVAEYDLWRWELPRAIDRAGLYLFFACPVMAGLCAWSAYRRRRDLGGLIEAVSDPGLVPRSGWLPIAFVALGTHLVVVLVHLLIAVFSDATGSVSPVQMLVQFLCIGAFCAFGALCGGVSRSHLVAPALLIGLLGANTLLAQTGFRRISQVGTGVADFVDLRFAAGYVGPKLVFFAALILMALPWRSARWPLITRPVRAVCGVVAVISLFLIWTYTGPQLVLRPEPRVCTGVAPQVCLPKSMAQDAPVVDAAVARGVAVLRTAGVTNLQPRVDVISRGVVQVPVGTHGLLISPAEVHDQHALLREVARAFSAAQMCEDMRSVTAPPEGVVMARAVLDGWLQTRLGAVEDGTFPPDGVQALERGTAPQQQAAVQQLFTAIWSCSKTVQPPT